MKLEKAPKSKNFQDRTGDTEFQKFLNLMLARLNPVYAYRNIKGASRQGMKLDQAPAPEGQIIDRTGIPMSEKMKPFLLEMLKNAQAGYMLHSPDYRMLAVDPILRIAHDPLSDSSQSFTRKR